MQYQLSINIDSAGLANIYAANQYITIVKSVTANPLQSGNLPVAWISFQPFQSNIVTWVETYNIYATVSSLQSGATIKQTSVTDVPVQTGMTYTLAEGSFSSASGGGSGVFTCANQQAPMLNFGLSQEAVINGVTVNAPLNAVPILYDESASFTPIENVSIFLSNIVNNGVVLSQIASNALPVTLTSQTPTATIGFADASNTFFLEQQKQRTQADLAQSLFLRR